MLLEVEELQVQYYKQTVMIPNNMDSQYYNVHRDQQQLVHTH